MHIQRMRRDIGPLWLNSWFIAFVTAAMTFGASAQAKTAPDATWADWETQDQHEDLASPFRLFEQAVGQSWTQDNLSSFDALGSGAVSLLEYLRKHIDPVPRDQIEKEIPRYNRRQAFKGWINEDSDVNCLDTRNEVLVRDADTDTPVGYQGIAKCVVVKGHWIDPYSGNEYKTARSMQIDHVVPLKNAYVSGAYRWTPERRCHYANYLKNDFHLLAVSGHENMSKSNRGPEDYMPPEQGFQCRYLSIWLKIKAIWELDASDREAETIQELAKELGCKSSMLQISATELRDQRALSQKPVEKCNRNFDQ